MNVKGVTALVLLGFAGGCDAVGDPASAPDVTRAMAEAPPGAAPGTCWSRHVTPAIVETVTEQVVLQPPQIASDGTVLSPGIYKTDTRQAIVQDRTETVFEVPCDPLLSAEFIASLQRALQARGLYRGVINGQMDKATNAAVRRYQRAEGLDSPILSLDTARNLGLVALDRESLQE